MRPIAELLMITPFESDIRGLGHQDQILKLKGCALCRITRDLDHDSVKSKAEWKTCKTELGVPVRVFAKYELQGELAELASEKTPLVVARLSDGDLVELLSPEVLERCNGRVTDLRGRLAFHANALGLALPART